MALKFSEMITVRTDLALNLEAGFDNYLAEVATGFADYLAPVLEEGETPLDVSFQLLLLRRSVRRHRRRLENLDGGVVEQAQGDEKVRAELDQRTEAVDAKLRQVRSACRGFYGLKNLGRIGLLGDFPRGPVRLHSRGLVVKASLENPAFSLEPVLELDPGNAEAKSVSAQLAAQLDPELSQLGELLDGRRNERKKSTDVRLRRREVIREFDYHIRGIVRMAQGMFRLAGRNDLGKRIRPILQRVIRKLDNQEAKEHADATAEATPETDDAAAEAAEGEPSQDTEPTVPEETTA